MLVVGGSTERGDTGLNGGSREGGSGISALYDPAARSWNAVAAVGAFRGPGHSATLIGDSVLLVGGDPTCHTSYAGEVLEPEAR